MALLWGDGFGHWGTAGNALAGGYAGFSGTIVNSPANARTGNYYLGITGSDPACRRVLDTPISTIFGMGAAFHAQSSVSECRFWIESGANILRISFNTSTLGVDVYWNATLLGSSAANIFLLNTYCQFEAKINLTGGAGNHSIEIRYNGVPVNVLTINGLTLGNITAFGLQGSGAALRFADLYSWDNSGTVNNDWLADRRCVTLLPSADTAFQDWTPSAGDGFDAVNNVPPGASYIEAATAGDISEFEKDPVPAITTSIAGLVIFAAVIKTDAGPGGYRLGMNKGGIVQNGAEIFPGTTLAFGHSILQTDPDGLAWTRTNLDNATVRITRTT